jgi:acyl dehydratase
MPIDREKVLAHQFPSGRGGYTRDGVILYQLGVGAGAKPTDPNELAYTYEKDLKVLPSFATVAGSGAGASLFDVPALKFDPRLLLHGEQDVEIHRPLPPEAKLSGRSRIADVFDKGKAALVIVEVVGSDEAGPLYTNRMSLFLRGEGGFGGPRGPEAGNEAPERAPDLVIESRTLPQQALLYRLCGDKNPLHADPDFAKGGGFDRPILHGLCSYGIVCKAVVDGALGGDPTRVARWQARFRGVAFPGETFETRCWREDGRILVEAWSKDRGQIILSNGCVTLRS